MCQAIVDGGRRCDIHRKEVAYFLPRISDGSLPLNLIRDTLQTLRTENKNKRFSERKLERLYEKIKEKSSTEAEFTLFKDSLAGEERISGPLLESLLTLESAIKTKKAETEKELRYISLRTGLSYNAVASKYASSRANAEDLTAEELDEIRQYAKSRNLFTDKKSLRALSETRKLIQFGSDAVTHQELPHLSEILVSGGYNPEAGNGRLELVFKTGESNVKAVYENVFHSEWEFIKNPETSPANFLRYLNTNIRSHRLLDVSDAELSRRLTNCVNCGQFRGDSHSCPASRPEDFFSETNIAVTQKESLPPAEREAIESELMQSSGNSIEEAELLSGRFPERYFVEVVESGIVLEVNLKQPISEIVDQITLDQTAKIPFKIKAETPGYTSLEDGEISGVIEITRRQDGLLEVTSYESNLKHEDSWGEVGTYNHSTEYIYRNFLSILDEVNKKSVLSPYGVSRPDVQISRNNLGEVTLTRTRIDPQDSFKLNSASVYGQPEGTPRSIVHGLNDISARSNNPMLSPLLYNLYFVREIYPSLTHEEINSAFSNGAKKVNMATKMRVGTDNGRDFLQMNLTLAKNDDGEIYVQDTSFITRCTCGRFMSAYGGFCAHEEGLRVFGANILTHEPQRVESGERPRNGVLWGRGITDSLRALDLLSRGNPEHEELVEKVRPFLRDTSVTIDSDKSEELLTALGELKTFVENNQRLVLLSEIRAEVRSGRGFAIRRRIDTALSQNDTEALEILAPEVSSLSQEYISRRRPVWEQWNEFSRNNSISMEELTERINANANLPALENMEYLEDNVLHGISDESESSRKFGIEVEFLSGYSSEEEYHPTRYREIDDSALRENVAYDLYNSGYSDTSDALVYHGTSQNGYQHWGVEEDCTVSGELVSRIIGETPDFWRRELREVLQVLKNNDCIPGNDAGLHVHVSTSSYRANPAKHIELIRLTNKYYPVLKVLGTNPFTRIHRSDDGNTYSSANYTLAEPNVVPATDNNDASGRISRYSEHSSPMNASNSGRYSRSDNVEYRISDSSLNAKQIQTQIIIANFLVEHAEKNVEENGSTTLQNNNRTEYLEPQRLRGLFGEFLDLFPDNRIRDNLIKLFAWNTASRN